MMSSASGAKIRLMMILKTKSDNHKKQDNFYVKRFCIEKIISYTNYYLF